MGGKNRKKQKNRKNSERRLLREEAKNISEENYGGVSKESGHEVARHETKSTEVSRRKQKVTDQNICSNASVLEIDTRKECCRSAISQYFTASSSSTNPEASTSLLDHVYQSLKIPKSRNEGIENSPTNPLSSKHEDCQVETNLYFSYKVEYSEIAKNLNPFPSICGISPDSSPAADVLSDVPEIYPSTTKTLNVLDTMASNMSNSSSIIPQMLDNQNKHNGRYQRISTKACDMKADPKTANPNHTEDTHYEEKLNTFPAFHSMSTDSSQITADAPALSEILMTKDKHSTAMKLSGSIPVTSFSSSNLMKRLQTLEGQDKVDKESKLKMYRNSTHTESFNCDRHPTNEVSSKLVDINPGENIKTFPTLNELIFGDTSVHSSLAVDVQKICTIKDRKRALNSNSYSENTSERSNSVSNENCLIPHLMENQHNSSDISHDSSETTALSSGVSQTSSKQETFNLLNTNEKYGEVSSGDCDLIDLKTEIVAPENSIAFDLDLFENPQGIQFGDFCPNLEFSKPVSTEDSHTSSTESEVTLSEKVLERPIDSSKEAFTASVKTESDLSPAIRHIQSITNDIVSLNGRVNDISLEVLNASNVMTSITECLSTLPISQLTAVTENALQQVQSLFSKNSESFCRTLLLYSENSDSAISEYQISSSEHLGDISTVSQTHGSSPLVISHSALIYLQATNSLLCKVHSSENSSAGHTSGTPLKDISGGSQTASLHSFQNESITVLQPASYNIPVLYTQASYNAASIPLQMLDCSSDLLQSGNISVPLQTSSDLLQSGNIRLSIPLQTSSDLLQSGNIRLSVPLQSSTDFLPTSNSTLPASYLNSCRAHLNSSQTSGSLAITPSVVLYTHSCFLLTVNNPLQAALADNIASTFAQNLNNLSVSSSNSCLSSLPAQVSENSSSELSRISHFPPDFPLNSDNTLSAASPASCILPSDLLQDSQSSFSDLSHSPKSPLPSPCSAESLASTDSLKIPSVALPGSKSFPFCKTPFSPRLKRLWEILKTWKLPVMIGLILTVGAIFRIRHFTLQKIYTKDVLLHIRNLFKVSKFLRLLRYTLSITIQIS